MLSDKGIHMYATTIAKIEAGDRAVQIDEATGIADLFDMSLDSLLGRNKALENELSYAVRTLREVAQKSVWDVNAVQGSVRTAFIDLFEFEFEGREGFEVAGKQAMDALADAQSALFKLAYTEPAPEAAVRLRDDLVERAANEKLLKLLKEVADEEES